MFPVLYSPNEPEDFLGFFTAWIRIREAYHYADPDPKHWVLVHISIDDSHTKIGIRGARHCIQSLTGGRVH